MTPSLTLAASFDPGSRDQWLAEVRRVLLKGKPDATDEDFLSAFDKRLVTRTDDGIEIQPLYTAADAPSDELNPGQAPFQRSTHAAPVPWQIRQRVWSGVQGSSALVELESGATGVLLTMDDDTDLATALQGVLLDLAPVGLDVPSVPGQVRAARGLTAAWDAAAIAIDDRRGCLGLDALGCWARSGGVFDLATAMDDIADVVRDVAVAAPNAQSVVVNGTVWHDAGATEAQELGWTIAAGVWIVRQLVQRDVDLATATRSLEFRLAASDDQFLTIAKLRAARRLWARVAEAAGLPATEQAMHLTAETSQVMLTRYDTWVNTLRSTVACFAAAVGGADAITVLPHDALITEGGTALGRRVARNTQSILMLESHLARVVDPAGGSWFVESLTADLAEAAWVRVQESETDGGIVAQLESGVIEEALTNAMSARDSKVATRRIALTGLSEFPNVDEEPPAPLVPRVPPANTRFAPLTLHRLADDFEAQRGRADVQAAASERPVIYLATLGTASQSTARAGYAKNLFEAGGIRTVSGPVEAFADSGATVACLCSADPVYAESGQQAVADLKAAGATRIYLAGKGAGIDGVDEEVGLGCDVLDVLTRALDSLGVAR